MWFYRALLWLYPSSFRNEYGAQLETAFESEHGGGHGLCSFLMLVPAALADVVPNAIAVQSDILRQDFRYGLRAIARAPGFAITAVLVVALGVGANTAAFSVADFVLVRPLPFDHPEQLVKVWSSTPGYPHMELSPPNYRDLKESAKVFSGFAAFTTTAVNLVAGGEPQRVEVALVTHDLFSVLRSRPLVGRGLTASDTVAGEAVVIGHAVWQSQFGGDRSIIGRRIEIDGRPSIIVGVMGPDFHFPTPAIDMWVPLRLPPIDAANRTDNELEGVARLRDGVSLEQARADLSLIAARLVRAYPKENENTGVDVVGLRDERSHRTKALLIALCGAALATLLLACANLANLLLARAVSREREIAVRAALGAGRDRLVRQLATESVVLASIGGAVGLGVAFVALPALSRLVPDTLPLAQQPSIDLRVLLAAALLIAVSTLAFGVAPAVRAGGARSVEALRDGARAGSNTRRTRTLLVMTEVTLSVALLISSGLLVRAMWRLRSVDPGFRADGVLTLRTALPFPKYSSVRRREHFLTGVLDGVRRLPGVTSAAYVTALPMAMRGGIWAVNLQGHETIREAANAASLRYVTPQYFATLGIPVVRGRDVAESDDSTHAYVAVVSRSFAERYWPNEEPIGKHFQFALHDRTVVGIVGDIRVRGLEQASEPQVYIPTQQVDDGWLLYYAPKDLVIRSTSPIATLVPEVRRIIRAADAQQPISDVRTMSRVIANETASRLAQLRLLGALAVVALLLAGVGLHGLLSFTVTSRVREIGVRVALGAQSGRILGMVLREGLLLSFGGLIPGIALGYAAARGMSSLLAGVTPGDPATFTVAIVVCAVTSLVGCLRPALRASRVDPAIALRSE